MYKLILALKIILAVLNSKSPAHIPSFFASFRYFSKNNFFFCSISESDKFSKSSPINS